MNLLENLLLWILLTVLFYCIFMAILTAASPKTQPNEIKVTGTEQKEIRIIIKTVPASAGTLPQE